MAFLKNIKTSFGNCKLDTKSFLQILLPAMEMMDLWVCWFRSKYSWKWKRSAQVSPDKDEDHLAEKNPNTSSRSTQHNSSWCKIAPAGQAEMNPMQLCQHDAGAKLNQSCLAAGLTWLYCSFWLTRGSLHSAIWQPLGLLQHGVTLCCVSLALAPRQPPNPHSFFLKTPFSCLSLSLLLTAHQGSRAESSRDLSSLDFYSRFCLRTQHSSNTVEALQETRDKDPWQLDPQLASCKSNI